jgi:hypothetical protein
VAISSASATVFSIGIIFLGYWGIHEPTQWRVADVFIVGFAVVGFGFLGLVPWVATGSAEPEDSDAKIRIARRMFVTGVSAIWLAIVTSVIF